MSDIGAQGGKVEDSDSQAEDVLKEATLDSDGEKEDHNVNYDQGPDDLTRPKEWRGRVPDSNGDIERPELREDSLGHDENSPDFVDEALLSSWSESLSAEQKEEKREEAKQCKQEGNSLYSQGSHSLASDSYTAGLRLCPLDYPEDRAVLYANRGQAKKVLGLKESAISNCSKAIQLNPEYLKAILRRAELYEETDKLEESLKDYESVLALDANHVEARRAKARLPQKIEERNEKLKAEMMDNLKKLGNMCLKPFGLSTNNFKMEQDPSSGSYNIQFVQNQ